MTQPQEAVGGATPADEIVSDAQQADEGLTIYVKNVSKSNDKYGFLNKIVRYTYYVYIYMCVCGYIYIINNKKNLIATSTKTRTCMNMYICIHTPSTHVYTYRY